MDGGFINCYREPSSHEKRLRKWLTVGWVDLTLYDDKLLPLRERMAWFDVSSNSGHMYANEVSSSSAIGVLGRCTIAREFVEEIDDDGDGF
jgi:hypothetical protein